MKILLLALLTLTLPLKAGTVTLEWDDQPSCDFHVWNGVELLQTVEGNEVTITLPDSGISTIRVTAFIPGGYGETAPAEIKLVPVAVQSSGDLKIWTDLTVVYAELADAMFFRLTPPSFQRPTDP